MCSQGKCILNLDTTFSIIISTVIHKEKKIMFYQALMTVGSKMSVKYLKHIEQTLRSGYQASLL